MRPVREITAEEERFRVEAVGAAFGTPFNVIRRDPVEPEPIGTIVLMAFRVTGYESDCDGSLMARLEHIDRDGDATGWEPRQIGLHPSAELVVTIDEWRGMFP